MQTCICEMPGEDVCRYIRIERENGRKKQPEREMRRLCQVLASISGLPLAFLLNFAIIESRSYDRIFTI